MHIKTKTNKKFHEFYKKNFQKLNFVGGKCVKIRSSINLTWGHPRSHTKVGPDRFNRFDVYLIQTNNTQTDKQSIYRDARINDSSRCIITTPLQSKPQ